MIENRFTTSEESFVDLAWWDACTTTCPVVADRSLPVWVAVDASVKRDSTAIAVFTWDRDTKRARLVWHRIFHPSLGDPINFERDVEATILDLHRRFKVKSVRYDPYQMAASAQRLIKLGVRMEEYPQTVGNLTAASQNLYELIKSQGIAVYRDDEIRLAVQRAVAVETTRGWRIAKAVNSAKIDIVVAMAMAALACVSKGESPQMRWGTYNPSGGDGRIHWKDNKEEQEAPRIRFIRVDEAGEEISAEEAQAMRHRLPGKG
jgi:phage terminase large subunit-like protein